MLDICSHDITHPVDMCQRQVGEEDSAAIETRSVNIGLAGHGYVSMFYDDTLRVVGRALVRE